MPAPRSGCQMDIFGGCLGDDSRDYSPFWNMMSVRGPLVQVVPGGNCDRPDEGYRESLFLNDSRALLVASRQG
jgi:hypothetical protein